MSLRLLKTFACFFGYFVTGLAMLIIPPTFVHLEVLFETTVAKLSLVFVTRSGFYLLGCVLGGLFFDRIGRKELQQSVILILRMIAVAISPFFSIFWFVATWGVFGLLTGYCETGINPYLLDAWNGHRMQRSMLQFINMGWTVGAAICPLMIQPFLAPLQTSFDLTNASSLKSNDFIITDVGVAVDISMSEVITNDTEFVQVADLLQHSFSSEAGIEGVLPKYTPDVTFVRYAYVSLAPVYLIAVSLFAFIPCVSLSHDEKKKLASGLCITDDMPQKTRTHFINVIFIFLSILLLFSFTCGESIMFSMIVPIAIKSWGWSSVKATLISTVILGCCLIGRIVGMLTSAWLKPKIILAVNITLFSMGCMMMLLLQYVPINDFFLWTSFAVLGLGSSSFNPTFMLYLNQHITLTSRLSSLMLFACNTAWLICPYSGSLLLEYVGHQAVFQLMFFVVIISVISSIALLCVSRKLMVMHKVNVDDVLKTEAKIKKINIYIETLSNCKGFSLTELEKLPV